MRGRSVTGRVTPDTTEAASGVSPETTSTALHLLVTVTFNPNQLRAHLAPLIALDDVASITIVADVPAPELPKVRSVVPTRVARRTLGRAGSKLALCLRLARRHRFDWILGFNFVPHGLNAQLTARSVHARSLYHMIGGDLEWLGGGYASDNNVLGRLRRPVPALERLLLSEMRKTTVTATMGPRARTDLLGRGFAPERVVVVPPSADVERFSPERRVSDPFDVVAVAALLPNKRLSDLIDAAALIRHRHPDVRVGVAGAGPLRQTLEQRARDRGVAGNVAFLGYVPEIESVYAGATAFVLCSRSEGMPVSMLEAMATGVAPVVADVGEISTLVVDGENGMLFASGDVRSLADRLDELLANRERARRLGVTARKDVVSRHAVDAVAGVYRGLFRTSLPG